MISRSIYSYFWFGTCFRYLLDAKAGHPIGDEKSGQALFSLIRFFSFLDKLDLRVTKRAARPLEDILKEFLKAGKNARLSETQASHLKELIRDTGTTLAAELEGLSAYITTPKRHDIKKLTEDVASLFSPGTFDKLPWIAQYDFKEAGKCIAFELPTAAAFHMLRATEAVLRVFYCTLVHQKRCDQMWGPMISDLRKRGKGAPHKVLLDNLDNIRGSYRNPTQHPEAIYNIEEVQDLWGLCVDPVSRMAKILPSREPDFPPF
jgi:hypothetical protein